MRAIFISYRREDAEGQAGRLFNDLSKHFGEDSVFMDVAGIAPGRDFRRVIDEHVASCGVLLAMIGKHWLDAKDDSGRLRLDDPTDFVRLETASALKRDIPVIPVLVHGASMPRAEQLPADLAELAYRNGVELTHARWDSDVQLLIKALRIHVPSMQADVDSAKPEPVSARPKAGTAGTVRPSDEPAGGSAHPAAPSSRKSLFTIVAASVVAIAVALGAYVAYEMSQKTDVASTVDAENVPSEQTGNSDAANTGGEPEKKTELAKTDGAARDAPTTRAPAAEARTQTARENRRTDARWHYDTFPPPNAGAVAFTIMPDGNPACASYDQVNCLWGLPIDEIEIERLRPLVCGEGHRAAHGTTGYEDPKHWCNLAKRARWHYDTFPPPNAGAVAFTIMPDGNPACASYDQVNCLWGLPIDEIEFERLRPLVCGEGHRAAHGTTGYEDPQHWCNLAKRAS